MAATKILREKDEIESLPKDEPALVLNVLPVGQGNFTVLTSGVFALVFDCGAGAGRPDSLGWPVSHDPSTVSKFSDKAKSILHAIFSKTKKVVVAISHDHRDHRCMAKSLIEFLKDEIRMQEEDIYECGTYNWNWIFNTTDRYEEDLRSIINSLGTHNRIKVIPLVSNIRGSTDIHDNCLVLKIIVERSNKERSIILPSDASCKMQKNMLRIGLNQNGIIEQSEANENFIKGANVVLPSHHGSEDETCWFSTAIQKSDNKAYSTLCIISTGETSEIPNCIAIEKMINSLPEHSKEHHDISCCSQKLSTNKPIFSTADIGNDEGELYRVFISRTGIISMYNNIELEKSYLVYKAKD